MLHLLDDDAQQGPDKADRIIETVDKFLQVGAFPMAPVVPPPPIIPQ